MPRPSQPIAGARLPGGLDHAEVIDLLGYNIALASIPAFAMFDKHIGKPLGLRRTDYTILVLASHNTEVTAKQLSAALSITSPSLTIIVDKLVASGWVIRSKSEADRRVQQLKLTPSGKKLLAKARLALLAMEEELTSMLTEAEYKTLLELLQKVALARHR